MNPAVKVSFLYILNMPYSERYDLAYKRSKKRGEAFLQMYNTKTGAKLTMCYARYLKEVDDYEAEHGKLDDDVDDYGYKAEYDDYIDYDSLDVDDNVDLSLGEKELEDPYTEINSVGYVYIDKRNGRRKIRIWNKQTKKKFTTAYARYLMSVKEGRFLRADEHVDHKDEDKTNDDISNLQILTPEEHHRKTIIARGFKLLIDVFIECPVCLNTFVRLINEDEYDEMLRKGEKMYCSRSCFHKSRKPAEMEDRICPQCNQVFTRPVWYFRSQEKTGIKNPFCSNSCAAEYYCSHPEETGFKPAKMEDRICPNCNRVFTRPARYFRKQEKAGVKNPCCSKSCATKCRRSKT